MQGRQAMPTDSTANERPPDERPDENYDIRIARDGTWFHEGRPIARPALVRLFASVLRRDAQGDYWLVTPAERGRITVEDVPFLAVALEVRGDGAEQELVFTTNLGQSVTAGPEHPIRVAIDPDTGEPGPYIGIRDNLEARINRPVYYELVDRGVEREVGGEIKFGIWSKGRFFPLGSLSET
jgi:hypothetical protein